MGRATGATRRQSLLINPLSSMQSPVSRGTNKKLYMPSHSSKVLQLIYCARNLCRKARENADGRGKGMEGGTDKALPSLCMGFGESSAVSFNRSWKLISRIDLLFERAEPGGRERTGLRDLDCHLALLHVRCGKARPRLTSRDSEESNNSPRRTWLGRVKGISMYGVSVALCHTHGHYASVGCSDVAGRKHSRDVIPKTRYYCGRGGAKMMVTGGRYRVYGPVVLSQRSPLKTNSSERRCFWLG